MVFTIKGFVLLDEEYDVLMNALLDMRKQTKSVETHDLAQCVHDIIEEHAEWGQID
jgi:hypothetical protein